MGFPSGQRDQTVNLTAKPSKVRILPPPPFKSARSQKAGSCLSEFSKARVWFNGRTSAFQADDAGSIPATRSISCVCAAQVAQLVEHTLGKGEVGGSNPLLSSIDCK